MQRKQLIPIRFQLLHLDRYHIHIVLGLLLVVLVLGLSIPPLFHDNQNTYFVHGLYSARQDWLTNDWFAQTQQPHVVFSVLVEMLDRINFLESGTYILQLGLYASFYLATWLIIDFVIHALNKEFSDPLPSHLQLRYAVTLFGVFVLVQQSSFVEYVMQRIPFQTIWERFWDLRGLANQYVLGGYLQPSEFGVLILLAIGLILKQRWYLGTSLLIAASNIQASYLLHSSILVLIITFWLYKNDKKCTSIRIAFLYCIAVVPVTLYMINMTNDPNIAQANAILAFERQPQHAVPAFFWGQALGTNTLKMIGIIFATMLAWYRRLGILKWILMIGLFYTGFGVMAVVMTGSASLGLVYPWRGSTFLYPLGLLVLTVVVEFFFIVFARRSIRHIDTGIQIVFLLILLVAVAWEFAASPTADVRLDINHEIVLARNQTNEDDVFLIPLGWTDFRLAAERATFGDWKNHPYRGSEVLEWWRRVELTQQFYAGTGSIRQHICYTERVDFYYVGIDQLDSTMEYQWVVASTEEYHLVECAQSR